MLKNGIRIITILVMDLHWIWTDYLLFILFIHSFSLTSQCSMQCSICSISLYITNFTITLLEWPLSLLNYYFLHNKVWPRSASPLPFQQTPSAQAVNWGRNLINHVRTGCPAIYGPLCKAKTLQDRHKNLFTIGENSLILLVLILIFVHLHPSSSVPLLGWPYIMYWALLS